MKKIVLSLSIILTAFALIACSKDKGGGNNANPANNGVYGSTPNDQGRCTNGYAGYNYNNYRNGYVPGAYYQGQIPQNQVNCIPQGSYHQGNPYYFQMGYQYYVGTCDFRFAGRGQLCPPGYSCQPGYGSMGVCLRGY